MRQLEVRRAVRGVGVAVGGDRLVVVLQHHDFDILDNVVVAPLYKATELPPVERIRLPVTFKRRQYTMAVDRLTSLPKRQLGRSQGDLEALRFEVIRAIDLIFSGF